jgi:thioester reductase-like protein
MNIVLTGATGSLGSYILQKILLDENIQLIYIPIRKKIHKTIQVRFDEICNFLLSKNEIDYQQNIKLITEKYIREKIIPLELDINNNIVMKEKKLSVNYIINCIACVDFNNNLDEACKSNIEPTLNLYNWSLQQENVKRFIHVSTAYVMPPSCKDEITVAPENLVNFNRNTQDIYNEIRNMKTVKCDNELTTMNFPNTYTFTKAICENLLYEIAQSKVPVSIVRPSMIGSDVNGYVKSYNATTIYFSLVQQSFLHNILCDTKTCLNIIPINHVCDIIMNELENTLAFNITHASIPTDKSLTNEVIQNYFNDIYNLNIKFHKKLAYPFYSNNYILYYKFLGLFYKNSKKLYDILYKINSSGYPFSIKSFDFQQKRNADIFKNFDFISYLHTYNLGIQKYLIKKTTIPENIPISVNNMIMIKGEKPEYITEGIMTGFIEFDNNNNNNYQYLKKKIDIIIEKGIFNLHVLKKGINLEKLCYINNKNYEYFTENNDTFNNFNDITIYNNEIKKSMDINKPFFNIILLNNYNGKNMLIINCHHIYADGVSYVKSFLTNVLTDVKPNKNDSLYKVTDSKYNFDINIFESILYCLSGAYDIICKLLDKKDINFLENSSNYTKQKIIITTDTFDVQKIKQIDTTKSFNMLAIELFIKALKSFNNSKNIPSSKYIKFAMPVNLHKDSEYIPVGNNFVTTSIKTKFVETNCDIKKDMISSMRPDKIYFLYLFHILMYYLPAFLCAFLKQTFMSKHSLIISSHVYSDSVLSINGNEITNFNSTIPFFSYDIPMTVTILTYKKKLHYVLSCCDNSLNKEFGVYLNNYIKNII